MTSDEIGKMVLYYRKKSGLSQQELARLSGVGKTTVYDIEKSKQTIQLNTLLNVLNTLNIEIKLIPPFPQIKESES
jgi:HTH-type transcriptional regulator/antitoxin HipB